MKFTTILLLGFCFFIGNTLLCKASEPDCTGNRHMDECGDFCPDPTTTTTTTTLPDIDDDGDVDVCNCPACPTVVCGDPKVTNNVYHVTVNRCPSGPKYTRTCQYFTFRNGKCPHHAVYVASYHGCVRCPNPFVPHRIQVPVY